LCTSFEIRFRLFIWIYRDKKVVGVFVRFSCAYASACDVNGAAFANAPERLDTMITGRGCWRASGIQRR
jgi:hypothetical protein